MDSTFFPKGMEASASALELLSSRYDEERRKHRRSRASAAAAGSNSTTLATVASQSQSASNTVLASSIFVDSSSLLSIQSIAAANVCPAGSASPPAASPSPLSMMLGIESVPQAAVPASAPPSIPSIPFVPVASIPSSSLAQEEPNFSEPVIEDFVSPHSSQQEVASARHVLLSPTASRPSSLSSSNQYLSIFSSVTPSAPLLPPPPLSLPLLSSISSASPSSSSSSLFSPTGPSLSSAFSPVISSSSSSHLSSPQELISPSANSSSNNSNTPWVPVPSQSLPSALISPPSPINFQQDLFDGPVCITSTLEYPRGASDLITHIIEFRLHPLKARLKMVDIFRFAFVKAKPFNVSVTEVKNKSEIAWASVSMKSKQLEHLLKVGRDILILLAQDGAVAEFDIQRQKEIQDAMQAHHFQQQQQQSSLLFPSSFNSASPSLPRSASSSPISMISDQPVLIPAIPMAISVPSPTLPSPSHLPSPSSHSEPKKKEKKDSHNNSNNHNKENEPSVPVVSNKRKSLSSASAATTPLATVASSNHSSNSTSSSLSAPSSSKRTRRSTNESHDGSASLQTPKASKAALTAPKKPSSFITPVSAPAAPVATAAKKGRTSFNSLSASIGYSSSSSSSSSVSASSSSSSAPRRGRRDHAFLSPIKSEASNALAVFNSPPATPERLAVESLSTLLAASSSAEISAVIPPPFASPASAFPASVASSATAPSSLVQQSPNSAAIAAISSLSDAAALASPLMRLQSPLVKQSSVSDALNAKIRANSSSSSFTIPTTPSSAAVVAANVASDASSAKRKLPLVIDENAQGLSAMDRAPSPVEMVEC